MSLRTSKMNYKRVAVSRPLTQVIYTNLARTTVFKKKIFISYNLGEDLGCHRVEWRWSPEDLRTCAVKEQLWIWRKICREKSMKCCNRSQNPTFYICTLHSIIISSEKLELLVTTQAIVSFTNNKPKEPVVDHRPVWAWRFQNTLWTNLVQALGSWGGAKKEGEREKQERT